MYVETLLSFHYLPFWHSSRCTSRTCNHPPTNFPSTYQLATKKKILTESGVEVEWDGGMGPNVTTLLQINVERVWQDFHATVNFQLRASGEALRWQFSGVRHRLKHTEKKTHITHPPPCKNYYKSLTNMVV